MTEEGITNKNDKVDEPTMDETEEFTFDMTMKKKKKNKKSTKDNVDALSNAITTDTIASTTTQTEVDSNMVPSLEETPLSTGANDAVAFSLNNDNKNGEGWLNSDRDYTYGELLGRVFSILRQNNPDLAGDRRKFTIIPPIIGREGSKKTAFTNISELCRRMRRPVEHVTSFLLTEMGTTGSLDANHRLIIKGRFQQLQVENLLRKYISEYVTCKTCRSPETQLSKENRLFFMKCDSCGSSRSVTTIKAGFKAQTGRRIRTD